MGWAAGTREANLSSHRSDHIWKVGSALCPEDEDRGQWPGIFSAGEDDSFDLRNRRGHCEGSSATALTAEMPPPRENPSPFSFHNLPGWSGQAGVQGGGLSYSERI